VNALFTGYASMPLPRMNSIARCPNIDTSDSFHIHPYLFWSQKVQILSIISMRACTCMCVCARTFCT